MAFEKLPERKDPEVPKTPEALKAERDALRMQVAPEKKEPSHLDNFRLAGAIAAMSADTPTQLGEKVNSPETAQNDRAKIDWLKNISAQLLNKQPANDTTNPLEIVNDKHDQAA